jgi:hypothetical protein
VVIAAAKVRAGAMRSIVAGSFLRIAVSILFRFRVEQGQCCTHNVVKTGG